MTQILILEDNPAMASLLTVVARHLKLECLQFITPSQAIKEKAIEQAKFIISDFEMPPENALLLLKYVKKNRIKTPIIMYSSAEDIVTTIEQAGYKDLINEYLEKPASIERIHALMTKYK